MTDSSRMPFAPVKPAALLPEGGASVKRTQVDWIKFVPGTECTEETCCIVLIRKRRTGKSIQEFCFQTRFPVKSGKISSWRQQRSFAQSSKIWNYEARTPSWISQHLHQRASATNLCLQIGITGHTNRICRISTRTSSSTRRIIFEGKGSPIYSNP